MTRWNAMELSSAIPAVLESTNRQRPEEELIAGGKRGERRPVDLVPSKQ